MKKVLSEKRVKELRATQTVEPDGGLREIRKEGVGVQKRFKFPLLFICRYVWLFVWSPLRSGSSVFIVQGSSPFNSINT